MSNQLTIKNAATGSIILSREMQGVSNHNVLQLLRLISEKCNYLLTGKVHEAMQIEDLSQIDTAIVREAMQERLDQCEYTLGGAIASQKLEQKLTDCLKKLERSSRKTAARLAAALVTPVDMPGERRPHLVFELLNFSAETIAAASATFHEHLMIYFSSVLQAIELSGGEVEKEECTYGLFMKSWNELETVLALFCSDVTTHQEKTHDDLAKESRSGLTAALLQLVQESEGNELFTEFIKLVKSEVQTKGFSDGWWEWPGALYKVGIDIQKLQTPAGAYTLHLYGGRGREPEVELANALGRSQGLKSTTVSMTLPVSGGLCTIDCDAIVDRLCRIPAFAKVRGERMAEQLLMRGNEWRPAFRTSDLPLVSRMERFSTFVELSGLGQSRSKESLFNQGQWQLQEASITAPVAQDHSDQFSFAVPKIHFIISSNASVLHRKGRHRGLPPIRNELPVFDEEDKRQMREFAKEIEQALR